MLETVEINPKNPATASVIWLHGLGADGYDFVDVVPKLNLLPELQVRFIFPHAPMRRVTLAQGMQLRAWFDIIALDESAREDAVGIKTSQELIIQLIEKELTRGVPANKIILAGFSQGGAMALQCGLRYTETLAGMLILSSWLPLALKVAEEKSSANQNTPILMLHGSYDNLVPVAFAERSVKYLKQLGYHVDYETFSMQHAVCDPEITKIGLWLTKNLFNNQ